MGLEFGIIKNPDQVVSTLNRIFGVGKITPEFVSWLSQCPYGENRWYALFDGEEAISVYGLLPLEARVGDVDYTAVLCNNVGTVPEWRGKGIFVRLGKKALMDANADIAIGVPNDAAVPGHRKVGWTTIGKLVMLSGKSEQCLQEMSRTRMIKHVSEFEFPHIAGRPLFQLTRGTQYIQWRYSKPGMVYWQSTFAGGRYAIWKEYEEKCQIMETNDWQLANIMGKSVDMWQLKGSVADRSLKAIGFKETLSRDLIVYTRKKITQNIERIRFEACDWDVF